VVLSDVAAAGDGGRVSLPAPEKLNRFCNWKNVGRANNETKEKAKKSNYLTDH
jgi:hypothetical protein